MDIIYNSMPTTWKNKMIQQCLNYADSTIKEMTDFFENRVENLETKQINKKSLKKRRQKDSDSSVVKSSEDSSVKCWSDRKYSILLINVVIIRRIARSCIWWSTSTYKKRNCKYKGKINKEINALIEKKFKKIIKYKKRRIDKKLQHFQKLLISKDKNKKSVSSLGEGIESEEI